MTEFRVPPKATYQYTKQTEDHAFLQRAVHARCERLAELYGEPRMKDVPNAVSWALVVLRALHPEVPLDVWRGERSLAVDIPLDFLLEAQAIIEGAFPDFLAPPRNGAGTVRGITLEEGDALFPRPSNS